MDKRIKEQREFMKSSFREKLDIETDQEKGKPYPKLQKEYPDKERIELPKPDESVIENDSLYKCIQARRSRRKYTEDPITLAELSYLLWSTQGVEKVIRDNYATLRTVPSAGARHPYDTYLIINNVEGLEKGIYVYLPLDNALVFLFSDESTTSKLQDIGQKFISTAPIVFIWSCIPYRCEWRYHILGHRPMLMDVGHICQNLYLAAESINCGTCGIAAYDQKKLDEFLNLDGINEYTVYLAPVGKI